MNDPLAQAENAAGRYCMYDGIDFVDFSTEPTPRCEVGRTLYAHKGSGIVGWDGKCEEPVSGVLVLDMEDGSPLKQFPLCAWHGQSLREICPEEPD